MDKTIDKMEQVKTLKNGYGIQYLLDAAYEIFGNHIAMFNTEYNLQAYTDVATDDPITNELVTQGCFSYETQILFKEEGFIDLVANAETTAFLISDKVKYDRIYGKLRNGNNVHVANLVMVAHNKPFEDDDEAAFEAVCKVLSQEIIRNEFYQTYGKLYQESYIRKLIDGEIIDKGLFAAHIAIVYREFTSGMRLIVADIGKFDPAYAKLSYFRELFDQIQSSFTYALYANYIVIIIHAERQSEFSPDRDLKNLYEVFERNHIYAGVSEWFDNMYQLRKHYDEAVNALRGGLKNGRNQQFFLFDESKWNPFHNNTAVNQD